MTIQFCKTCQKNNVNTRVEWRPHPSGKNKPFDIDKNEWHSPCPYWKPDPNYKAKLKPEDQAVFDKIESELSSGTLTSTDITDIKKTLIKIEEITSACLKLLQKIAGFDQASNLK